MTRKVLQFLGLAVALAACTPTYYVKVSPTGDFKKAKEQPKLRYAVAVRPLEDGRKVSSDPEAVRRIGRVGQGLFDSDAAFIEPEQTVVLSEEVTEGLVDALKARGVVIAPEDKASLFLEGKITKYSINGRYTNMPIGPGIAIEGTFRATLALVAKTKSGKVVWKDTIKYQKRDEDAIILVTQGKIEEFYHSLAKKGAKGVLVKAAKTVAEVKL